MNWQTLVNLGISLLANLITPIVVLVLLRGFRPILRLLKEPFYLCNILHTKRFAQWKPKTGRYVALNAIKAQKGDSGSTPQPLLNLMKFIVTMPPAFWKNGGRKARLHWPSSPPALARSPPSKSR